MIDKDRVLVDCGSVALSMLGHDLFNPMHLRFTVRLDHQIDPELLGEAWERTKRVYPIIDAVLGFDVGDEDFYRQNPSRIFEHAETHLYLLKPEGGLNAPIHSRKALVPDTEYTAGRLIAITYHDDTLVVGAYHLLFDGRGFQMVCNTLLYSYLALYTAHEDEHPVVELREGRPLSEYYAQPDLAHLFSEDYTPSSVYELPAGQRGFGDPDMREDEGSVTAGTLEVDAADFMRLCKSHGANPAAMMAVLVGRATYALNPDQQEGIIFEFTVSARDVLGIPDTIANAAVGGVSHATRDAIERKSLAELAQAIRGDLAAMRTRDYAISFFKFLMSGKGFPEYTAYRITYMGSFTIGDNDRHIKEMGLGTSGCGDLYLFQVNDHFVLAPHYGHATQKYLDEFVRIFSELGVRAEITHSAHLLELDTVAPAV